MNPYSEKFKRLSDARLMGIVEQAHDYEYEAVEAARKELASRGLTDKEQEEAREIKNKLRDYDNTQVLNTGVASARLAARFGGLLYIFNPNREEYDDVRLITQLAVFLSILLLITMLLVYGSTFYYFPEIDLADMLIAVRPVLVTFAIFIGALLIAKRLKAGWYILLIAGGHFLYDGLLGQFFSLLYSIRWDTPLFLDRLDSLSAVGIIPNNFWYGLVLTGFMLSAVIRRHFNVNRSEIIFCLTIPLLGILIEFAL